MGDIRSLSKEQQDLYMQHYSLVEKARCPGVDPEDAFSVAALALAVGILALTDSVENVALYLSACVRNALKREQGGGKGTETSRLGDRDINVLDLNTQAEIYISDITDDLSDADSEFLCKYMEVGGLRPLADYYGISKSQAARKIHKIKSSINGTL